MAAKTWPHLNVKENLAHHCIGNVDLPRHKFDPFPLVVSTYRLY
jgi:hypothetical protein